MTSDTSIDAPNIIRAEHSTEQHYFIMRRDTAQDNGLSFEARGVIAYLLSKPPDWTINETELQKAGGIGRQKMRKVIAELVEKSYMQKSDPQRAPDTQRFLPTVFTLYEAKTGAVYEKPSTASRQREIIQLQSKEVKSKEDNTTGAKSAPDAGRFPEGTIGFDEMLDHLDLTQADIDATPLDELIDDPVGEYYRDMATVDDPPKPKRKRSEKQLALDGMKDALAKAFGLDPDKVTKTKWGEFGAAGSELLLVGATPDEMKPLHAWCKRQDWPSFTSMAMAKSYADWQKEQQPTSPRRTEPPLTDEIRMANVRELMTPFPTGGDE